MTVTPNHMSDAEWAEWVTGWCRRWDDQTVLALCRMTEGRIAESEKHLHLHCLLTAECRERGLTLTT